MALSSVRNKYILIYFSAFPVSLCVALICAHFLGDIFAGVLFPLFLAFTYWASTIKCPNCGKPIGARAFGGGIFSIPAFKIFPPKNCTKCHDVL